MRRETRGEAEGLDQDRDREGEAREKDREKEVREKDREEETREKDREEEVREKDRHRQEVIQPIPQAMVVVVVRLQAVEQTISMSNLIQSLER